MKKKIIPIVIFLGAAAGAFWFWRSRDPNAHGRLSVSGNLEITQVDLSFKTAGRLVELTVREGDRVKKGQIIARLDRLQLERQRERDIAAVTAASSAHRQLQTSIEYQRATLESDVAAREAELRSMEARLAEMLAGSRKQEIEGARAAVAEAKSQQEGARRDWERAQALYKNEDISTAQFDAARTKYQSVTEAARQAEQRLALVEEGPRKEEIESARAQVAKSRAAVKLAEAARIEVRRKEQELDARRAEIERARAQAGIVEAQLADMVIESPIDGIVLVKSAEAGEVLAAGTTVVSIGDLEHPWLRAYINERDLGRVKIGSKVRLSTDSFPGKSYWGQVSFIASEAEFTPKQIQTKEERVKLVYRIKVEVENRAQELKNNMPVDGEIVDQGQAP